MVPVFPYAGIPLLSFAFVAVPYDIFTGPDSKSAVIYAADSLIACDSFT